jgi:hypothetical protein
VTVELRFRSAQLGPGVTLCVEIEHDVDGLVTGRERVIAAWPGRGVPALVTAREGHKLPHHLKVDRWVRSAALLRRAMAELRRAGALDLEQAALDRLALFVDEADRQAKWSYLRQARLREAAWALGLERPLTEEDLKPRERTGPARPRRKRKPYPNVRI